MNRLLSAINKNNLDKVIKTCDGVDLNSSFHVNVQPTLSRTSGDITSYLQFAYLTKSREIAVYLLDELLKEKYLGKEICFDVESILNKIIEGRDIDFLRKLFKLNITQDFSSSVITKSLKSLEIRDIFNEKGLYHKFHEKKCLFREIHEIDEIEYLYNIGLNVNKHINSFILQYLYKKNKNRIEVLKKMIDLGVYLIPCNLGDIKDEKYDLLGLTGSVFNMECYLIRDRFIELLKGMENFDDFNEMNNNVFK